MVVLLDFFHVFFNDRGQFLGVNGFADVSVTTGVQDFLFITLHGMGGYRNYGNGATGGICLDLLCQGQPINAGKLDIHEDDRGLLVL